MHQPKEAFSHEIRVCIHYFIKRGEQIDGWLMSYFPQSCHCCLGLATADSDIKSAQWGGPQVWGVSEQQCTDIHQVSSILANIRLWERAWVSNPQSAPAGCDSLLPSQSCHFSTHDDTVLPPQSQDCACLVQCHVPSTFRHSNMMMTTSSRFSRNVPTPPMQALRGALSLTTFTGLFPSFAAEDLFLSGGRGN